MAEWLRLPSGQAVNMDRFVAVRPGKDDDLTLISENWAPEAVTGADARAVWAYIERVYVGERTADERPPRGRDNPITKG